jgi:uncharacterized membrane protein YhaH (DUF805 family)
MRLLSLLFDPRGAIDRRAFWSGLIQLTLVSLAVFVGLARLDAGVASAALPAVGEAFAIGGLASCIHGARAPDVSLIAALLVIAARLYVTACLVLKRSRDAGGGAGPLVAVGLASLLVHGLMGRWSDTLWASEMGTIIPVFLGIAVDAVLWAILLVRTGAVPTRPRMEAA